MSGDDRASAGDYILAARRWLLVANRDVRSAHACLGVPDPIPEAAAYHCQQAAEKLIKGLLVLARVPFRKTHDLEALRDLVVPRFPDLAGMIDRLVPLTDWGHVFRYPDFGTDPVPSPQELSDILNDIQRLTERIIPLIDPPPPG